MEPVSPLLVLHVAPDMISAELVQFVQSGVSILVGTRDQDLVPEACRGMGAHVHLVHGVSRAHEKAPEITVFLPAATNARTLANLRDNGRIAVCFSRAHDHRSVQFKGQVVAMAPAAESDRQIVDGYRGAIAHAWGEVGFPPRITMRVAHWPCTAVRFAVESTFVQTPGPGAGERLGGAVGRRDTGAQPA